jgi:hypothetical protein
MEQLSGLDVKPPPAKGSADGAAQPEKPAAQSPLPASTGGGAKSDDPFTWLSEHLFPGKGALPPAASGTGAKPGGRPYELPLKTVFTSGPPSPPATPVGVKPEKLRVDTPVTSEPAGKMQGSSPGDAATTGKPKAESPLPASTGGGAKSDDPSDRVRNSFSAGGDALSPRTGARPEGPAAGLPPAEVPRNTFFTMDPPPPPLAAPGGGKPEKLRIDTSVTIEPTGKMQGSSPGDAGTPGRPATDPPSAPPASAGGARPDKPGKVHVEASVDIEPPATGAGGPATPPPSSPPVLSEMQRFQETQQQSMLQQVELQQQNMKMQLFTAQMSAEMSLNSALVSLITKGGEAIKHAAGG